MNVLTSNDRLEITNMASCGTALRMYVELYDKAGAFISRSNILDNDREKLKQMSESTILYMSVILVEGSVDGFRIAFNACKPDIEVGKVRFVFEHASQPMRILNIGYSVVRMNNESVIISDQVRFDIMELVWNDKEGCFDIKTTYSNIEEKSSANKKSSGLTKEDIRAMIDADLKILSYYNKTEEIKQLTEDLRQFKADESRWTAGELFDMEKRIAAIVATVVADIRQYREKLHKQ